jgi:two-component system response regulator DesR
MTIEILIVDDREVVRQELRNLLNLSGELSVVGESADGWQAVQKAKELQPDIVLMDLEMPGLDGFEATRQIKSLQLAKTVIIFTVYADEFNRQKALQAGADAFIEKGTDLKILLELFKKISSGKHNLPDISENSGKENTL